jgi:uncharacterized protein (DUF305 family)
MGTSTAAVIQPKITNQGAIDMAEVELRYGKDPALRKMAEDIIATQKKEIEDFKAWQKKHGM